MSDNATQWRRLGDALVLGPYMMYSARHMPSPWFRHGMTLVGLGTILYNAASWLRDRENGGELSAVLGALGYPLSPAETAAVEAWWPTVREYLPARFTDINWQAIGFSDSGVSPATEAFLTKHWPTIRVAANYQDINWDFLPDGAAPYDPAPPPIKSPTSPQVPVKEPPQDPDADVDAAAAELEAAQQAFADELAATEQAFVDQLEQMAADGATVAELEAARDALVGELAEREAAFAAEMDSRTNQLHAELAAQARRSGASAPPTVTTLPAPSSGPRPTSAPPAAQTTQTTAAGAGLGAVGWMIPVGLGALLWWHWSKSNSNNRQRPRRRRSSAQRRSRSAR